MRLYPRVKRVARDGRLRRDGRLVTGRQGEGVTGDRGWETGDGETRGLGDKVTKPDRAQMNGPFIYEREKGRRGEFRWRVCQQWIDLTII